MFKIGEINSLKVLKVIPKGVYLVNEKDEEVFLSQKHISKELKVRDPIDVFLYTNNEGELLATTAKPKIAIDSFACLEVMSVEEEGTYFDMGLDHELLVPYEEQTIESNIGDWRIVFVILDDESQMLFGSMKWKEFCFAEETNYTINQKVSVMIGEKTHLGRNVLIDEANYGLIYANEIFEELKIGQVREAYIKKIREDGEIDISLQKLGYGKIANSSDKILALLKSNNGILKIGDKSSPEKIILLTGMSKKTFKKAIGDLYRKKLVQLDTEEVKLIK